RERVAVDGAVEGRVRFQRVDGRREHVLARAEPAVVERLLAEAVPDQVQPALPTVPQREREHAVDPVQGAPQAPAGDRLDQHLRVGVPAERDPAGRELRGELAVAVDLAVVGEHPTPVPRAHRLGAVVRQVDDREAPVRQGDPRGGVDPVAGAAGAPVHHAGRHRRHRGGELALATTGPRCQHPGDAAHQPTSATLPAPATSRAYTAPCRRTACDASKCRDSPSAAAPMRRRSAASATSRPSAAPNAAGSSGGTRTPGESGPSRTWSTRPPTAVATVGTPIAVASMNATGSPSWREARQNTSAAASRRPTSGRKPRNRKRPPSPERAWARRSSSSSGPCPTDANTTSACRSTTSRAARSSTS